MIGNKITIFMLLVAGSCLNYVQTIDTSYRGIRTHEGNSSDQNYHSSMLCMDIRPQRSVIIDEIMGMWYGVEIIVHNQDIPGVFKYDSCVVVHLSDITDQMPTQTRDHFYNQNYNSNSNGNYYRQTPQYSTLGVTDRYYNSPQQQQQAQTPPQLHYNNHQPATGFHNIFDSASSDVNYDNNNNENNGLRPKYLQLVWTENNNKNLEYTFNYTDASRGLWTNVGDQRGTLALPNQYTQFTGTVQVVKAVNDHLVLTFCSSNVKSSIYTIVLSRNHLGLSDDVLRSVRSLLSNRGLSTKTIRKVCSNSVSKASLSTGLLFITLTLAMILSKYF